VCIFFDQDGAVVYRYRTYGVEEVLPYAPEPRVRPNNPINLVAPGERGVIQTRGNWGFETGRFDWNARNDRLATSPLWSQLWMRPGQHVLVPMSHAYEATLRHGPRQWYAVRRRDGEPLWVPALGRIQAGKHRTEWHVSVVTVDAGPVFSPIHDTPREIVCLRDWQEARTWLAANDEAAVRRLLRPAGGDLLEAYRVHDDVFRDSFPATRCAEPFSPPRRVRLDAFDS
jgi:putative SOS response-associated peptidase YedK